MALPAAGGKDTDRDGLTDRFEVRPARTNPARSDSDRDGVPDGWEVKRSLTDPRRRDTDRDGLSDGAEIKRYLTKPRRADSDRDGISDGAEVRRYRTNPLRADTDGDGRRDGDEIRAGTDPSRGPDSPERPPVEDGGRRPEPVEPTGDAPGTPSVAPPSVSPPAPIPPPPAPIPPPPTPVLPDVYVSTTGSDTNDGRTAGTAVATIGRAYRVASAGQVIGVLPGDYANQSINVSKTGSRVRLTALGHVWIPGLYLYSAKHLLIDGDFEVGIFYTDGRGSGGFVQDVELNGVHLRSGALQAVKDFKILNSELGPNGWTTDPTRQDDILYAGTGMSYNVLIEGNWFHDATKPNEPAHTDCIQMTMGTDVTIRRNKFQRCFDQSLILKGDQGPLTRFTLENNFIDKPVSSTSPFGLQLVGTSPCEDCRVVNNTFLGVPRIEAPTIGTAVVTGNLAENGGTASCSTSIAKGWVWTFNVFETSPCGSSSYAIPGGNALFANRATLDLHLLPGSPALGRGNPARFPGDDFDGELRPATAAPDAGADQR
jgi:hypothetical protein